MKFKFLTVRLGFCLSTLLLLSACGGGGGGSTATTVSTVTPPIISPTSITYTQANAKPLAGLGLLTVESLSRRVLLQQGFFVGYLKGYSTRSSNVQVDTDFGPCDDFSTTPNVPGTGTYSITVTKGGTYRGVKPNDTISFNFSGCTFPNASFTLNGQALLTSAGTYVDSTVNTLFAYRLNSTNYNYSSYPAGQQNVYNGSVSVSYDGTTGGIDYPNLTATATSAYSVAIYSSLTALTPTITNALSSLATLTYAPTSAGSYTASLNGDASVASTSAPILLKFATNTQLAGSSLTGRLVPTSGVLRVTDRAVNFLTRTTVTGTNVAVDFDSDRDGSLDSSFTTTYSSLTTN